MLEGSLHVHVKAVVQVHHVKAVCGVPGTGVHI